MPIDKKKTHTNFLRSKRHMACACCFAALCLTLAGGIFAAETAKPQWRYVAPKAGERMEHPPLRQLPLSGVKPPELEESVQYRGHERLYAEFRFGTSGSTLVTVVIDRISDAEADVYVDRDRNRKIEGEERLAGPGPKYRVPLDVEIVAGEQKEHVPREVVFRLGRSGRSLSYATAGYVEGVVLIDGRKLPARRVDANGDGGMADPCDLLWINFKRDGIWNPFTDRLALTPIIQADNRRYTVRSDWVGGRLSLEKLEGSGRLRLALPKDIGKGDLMEIDLLFIARDGSIVKLDLAHDDVEAPVGEYSLCELSAVLKDHSGGAPWAFSFGREFHWTGMEKTRIYDVKTNSRAEVRPFDKIALDAKLVENKRQYRPDQTVAVRPVVRTADNMTLQSCYRSVRPDSSSRHPGAEIYLKAVDGKAIDQASSGFS
jgi:hypothetical protein